MEIVYIVMIKDGIMLPSVFNELFEEERGGRLSDHFLLLSFTDQLPSQWVFFPLHSGNPDMI